MATKKKIAKKTAKKTVEPEGITARIVMDITEDTPVYYINYAEIIHSRHEFGMYAVQLPTKLSAQDADQAKTSGELHLEPVLQLLMPPTVISGLIDALKIQKDAYEKEYGKIQDEAKKK